VTITIAFFAGWFLVVGLAYKFGGQTAGKIAATVFLLFIWPFVVSFLLQPEIRARYYIWEYWQFCEVLLKEEPLGFMIWFLMMLPVIIWIWRSSSATGPKFRWKRERAGDEREERGERLGALTLTVKPSHVRLKGDGRDTCSLIAEAYDERGPRPDAGFRFSLVSREAGKIWQTGNMATLQSSLTLQDIRTRVTCSASARAEDGSVMTSTPQYVDVEVVGLKPRLTLTAIPEAVAASSESRVTIKAAYEECGEPTQPRSNIVFKTLKGEEAGRLNVANGVTAVFTPMDEGVAEGEAMEVEVQGTVTVPELRSQVRGEATFTVGLRHLSVIEIEKGIWKRY